MCDLYNTIAFLCESKGITAYKLCKDIGIRPSIITDLKMGRKSGMKAETANKIATYFGVSVGYLLGEETEKAVNQQADDLSFDDFTYAMYDESKELTEEDKAILLSMAKQLKEARQKKD